MLGLGPGSASGRSGVAANNGDAYAAILKAEADDLAAITGDTGSADDWAAQAGQYAVLQAQILRDMHARDAAAADDYAEQDPELARLLGLGLDLGDEDGPNDDFGLGFGMSAPAPAAAKQSVDVGVRGAPSIATAAWTAPAQQPTSTVMSGADLEAQLLGMDAPSSAAPAGSSKGVPTLLSVEDMSPVPIPAGWTVGMALPPGTFLVFEEEEAQPVPVAKEQVPAASGGLLTPALQSGVAPVLLSGPAPSGYAGQAQAPQAVQAQGMALPMGQGQQQGAQAAFPPGYGPMGPMAGSGMAPPPGLLHPQALQAMQYQWNQLVQAVQAHPGQPIPQQIQEQLHFLQVSLQRHMIAMQQLNAMHSQHMQQQQQQGPRQPSLPPAEAPVAVPQATQAAPVPTKAAATTPQQVSFAQAAAAPQGKSATAPAVNILQRERPAQPTAGAIGTRAPPLPPGPAPPLPPGPAPGPRAPAQPVTMATVLTSKVPPPRALSGKSRMSLQEILGVCRGMFNQLSALDPFTECYYALVLQTKKTAAAAAAAEAAHRAALGLPPTAASAGGNVLDVAATLTDLGGRVLARSAGKGGAEIGLGLEKGAKEGKTPSKDKNGRGGRRGEGRKGQAATTAGATPGTEQGDSAAGEEAQADSTTAEAEQPQMTAAAALIASLPVQTIGMRNVRANQLDLKKLHAVKRRLWEQSNSVLGRQESINIRAPKRTLNLSETGTTSADDLRDGQEHVSNAQSLTVGSPEARESGPAAQLWAVRARIDAAHEGILALQEAARKHQVTLRIRPSPPADVVEGGRAEVHYRRANLAEIVGLTLVEGGGGAPEAAAAAQGAIAGYTVEDAVLSAMLTLPKGKKVVGRLVPMLEPGARVAAVSACMRLLPYCVASAQAGKDYEDADAALGSALSAWVSSFVPPAPVAGAAPDAALSVLGMITAWVDALSHAHNGGVIRALLQHPGASDVIATLLQRGTAVVASIQASTGAAALGEQAGAGAAGREREAQELSAWNISTEALGKAFVEAA